MSIRWEKLGEEPVYVGFRNLVKRTFEKARKRKKTDRVCEVWVTVSGWSVARSVARSETGHS